MNNNIYTPATDVHHVERHSGDVEKFYTNNLQALCHSCHSKKTVVEMNTRGGKNV
jgi:5-methylcytosine-specific restriction protein A